MSASMRLQATEAVDWLSLDSAEPAGQAAPAREAADDRDGATRSFEDVYRADYGRMVRAARLLTGSTATAEEIVQDAFVALYPRFERLADPSGYLYRSVVNGCFTQHRRNRVVERFRHLHAVGDAVAPDLDETWLELRKLPPRRRAAVVLRFYADLPVAEVAEVLGCQPGTVKSMLHRALAQLRDVVTR